MSSSVSIIMKVWNAPEHARLCIKTLLQNTDYPFELILVDNGSRAEVVQFLRATALTDPRVRLIENPENRGPGEANRQGALAAKNDLICLIDSDVLVPGHWLSRLVAAFEGHPGVRMLVPLRYHQTLDHPFEPTNSLAAWFRTRQETRKRSPLQQFYAYSRGLGIDEFDALMCSGSTQELKVLDCPPTFAGTCCALLDAGFAMRAGGIADPRFAGYGSEDVDLCWRIGEMGGLVAQSGTVYVHHFHHASMIDNAVETDAALRRANQILYEKWKPKLIELVRAELLRGVSPRSYLNAHFIFQPLSAHTSFIHDLREATGRRDIPERVGWRPQA